MFLAYRLHVLTSRTNYVRKQKKNTREILMRNKISLAHKVKNLFHFRNNNKNDIYKV